MRRREFLAGPIALLAHQVFAADDYPSVVSGRALRFPRDHGSHPAFRNEWWYVTGWVNAKDRGDFGLQITFFRNRPGIAEDNPSLFAPGQLLFAHAALSDPKLGRLLHDQRAARAGFGLAEASETDTDVRIDRWSLRRTGDRHVARIPARDFDFALEFHGTAPVLLQGEGGYSAKGPEPGQASYYYSRPQLSVSGTMRRGGESLPVTGKAWLDHEWSSQALAAQAAGWDWIGINLADGGALMAFRMRGREGGDFWAGGTLRDPDGRTRIFAPGEVKFEPVRLWRSPRTQAQYPVSMRIRAGAVELLLEPIMDDQEMDTRASTGTVYWEGAVRASSAGRPAGRGYLELTGYWKPLKL